MHKRVAVAAIGILGAVLLTEARAADAIVEPAPAPIEAAPVWTWTGCYAGVNLGYVHGNNDALDAPFTEGPFAGTGFSWNTVGPPYETIESDDSSVIGGGELGCDYAMPMGSTQLVLGAAVDLSALGLSGEGTSSITSDTHTSFDVDWVTTVRGRVGVAPNPALLIYATGGYAAAGIDVSAFDRTAFPSVGTMDVSGGGTESGWVVGGGGEW